MNVSQSAPPGRTSPLARILVRLALLGVLVGVALWFFSGGPGAPQIAPGTTLVLDVEGSYVEAPAAPLVSRLMGDDRRPFAALLSQFAVAQRDDRIDTVVLRMRGTRIGWGKAQELRGAIADLRAEGKKTLAYLELASFSASRDYYIASAADEVVVPPGALVPVVGLAAEYMFLGGLWEKLGIEVESERIGRYKSAVDSYTGVEMSESHREMANSILDSVDAQFVEGIAEGRGLPVDAVRSAIDAGPVLGSELEELGFIDRVAHLGDLEAMRKATVSGADYAAVDPAQVGFEPQASFALVYGAGTVVTGDGGRSPGGGPVFAADVVKKALSAAADDPEIDAIILRIDSPGGSSLASEVVWRAIQDVRERGKPVIASLSDVAASGGYYAAVAADRIVGDAGVLTGSIGVFVLRPVVGGLLEKLGVGVEALTRGERADFLLASEALSPGARDRLRAIVVDTYDLFVQRVAEGRKLDPEAVDALGQGRVWTGAQAVERGLIDEVGGLRDAVTAGRRLLGLADDVDVELRVFPPPRGLADELTDLLRGSAGWAALSDSLPLPEPLRRLEGWLLSLPPRTPLLIPPLLLDVR
ncbi:MAG: signal peptide peptidase SppA [Myxococcota bacterium]